MKKITKTYQDKTVKEIEKLSDVLRLEIAKMVLSKKSSGVKDTNLIHKKRKELAVMLTVLTEKKTAETLKK